VSFGEFAGQRSWDDARKYGFIFAGGGIFCSRTLRSLPVGARVFVDIPQTGYVGVGTTSGEAARFDDAIVTTDGQQRKLAELPLAGGYHHTEADNPHMSAVLAPVERTLVAADRFAGTPRTKPCHSLTVIIRY
jgi:hypothetical protein